MTIRRHPAISRALAVTLALGLAGLTLAGHVTIDRAAAAEDGPPAGTLPPLFPSGMAPAIPAPADAAPSAAAGSDATGSPTGAAPTAAPTAPAGAAPAATRVVPAAAASSAATAPPAATAPAAPVPAAVPPAAPQTAAPPAVAATRPEPRAPIRRPNPSVLPVATGCGSPGAVGVSRTVEIDTTAGPRFGQQQYKDIDFLEEGEIVLTFDDGPLRPYTMPVLKALEAHCTRATFFFVGRMALIDPDLVRDTARRGHTIGTHTFSHGDARKIGPVRAKAEAELGLSAVSRALGEPAAPFFRFPYLSNPSTTETYVRGRQMGVFSIDVDSVDYRTREPDVVQRAILSQLAVKRKGILLFHDIQPATAGAMMGLLAELKARGFRVVHIVPKAKSVTLAEFDTMAEKEGKRRPTGGLADRAVIWAAETAGPVADPTPKATPGVEVLPWGTVATRPPAAVGSGAASGSAATAPATAPGASSARAPSPRPAPATAAAPGPTSPAGTSPTSVSPTPAGAPAQENDWLSRLFQ